MGYYLFDDLNIRQCRPHKIRQLRVKIGTGVAINVLLKYRDAEGNGFRTFGYRDALIHFGPRAGPANRDCTTIRVQIFCNALCVCV